MTVHGGGVHVTDAVVRARDDTPNSVWVTAAELSAASARNTTLVATESTSSTSNCNQAFVIVAPAGIDSGRKRIPTVSGWPPSRTNSRSLLPRSTVPSGRSSASSLPTLTRASTTAALTVTVTSSLADRSPSLAVSRNTYVPLSLKLTLVSTLPGLANCAPAAGPLTSDQATVTAPGGFGNPSSVTVPSSSAGVPTVVTWSAPSDTDGVSFAGGVPATYSTWSSGAAAAFPSKLCAVRRPLPVAISINALPDAHPGRLTTSCTSAAS